MAVLQDQEVESVNNSLERKNPQKGNGENSSGNLTSGQSEPQTNSIHKVSTDKVGTDNVVPHLDSAASVDEISISESISLLRRFHLGDPDAAQQTDIPDDGLLPALLNPYRGVRRFRHEYPLYLKPAQGGDDGGLAQPLLAQPLADFLAGAVEKFAPQAESSRILKDNLPWLENNLCEQLIDRQSPVEAKTLLAEAGKALQEQIGLSKTNRELLQKDLDQLQACFVEDSQLLDYGPNVAIHLLRHTILHRNQLIQRKFKQTLQEQIRGLNQLLVIEREKSKTATNPKEVQDRVGEASRYFDSSVLSDVLEHRPHGSVSMTEKHLQRIVEILELLQSHGDESNPIRFIATPDSTWLEDSDNFNLIKDPDPCCKALEVYEEEAAKYARLFSASRIAQLEIEGRYDPEVHDSWFNNFDWEAFTREELLLLPTVVVLESAERIAGEGLRTFSHLLNSAKPIQILTWVHAHSNPGVESAEDSLHSFRMELAYFGIGHRQAIVTQASASRHDQLLNEFTTALNSTRTSLHLVNTGFRDGFKVGFKDKSEPYDLDPWMMASAALESRAHPFIQVNPGDTDNSQAQTDFAGNPHPDRNWSTNAFSYQDESGETIETELCFTFADYCLLHSELRNHFRVIPSGCDGQDMISVDAYLSAPPDTLNKAIPFVWAVHSDGLLQKLAVSRGLVLACRDRQNYWRTLQALTGVRNDFVDMAIQKVREEEQAVAEADREQLKNEHAQELERVRTETAGEVMGQLTDVLLGLDLSSLSSETKQLDRESVPKVPVDETKDTKDTKDTEVESQAEQDTSDEEEISFDEPWIDSIFCTTCDDCMEINKQLFVYNENKQAMLTDPKNGTFAQLVAAAELCPAKCIHPGKPLDANEPDIDELIKRAEPFN